MYISCSTLCFGRSSFEQTLRSINELQFQKIDLAIRERGPHLRPTEIAADVNKHAQYLRSTGLMYAAFQLEIDSTDQERYRELFRSVCRLGKLLSVPVVTIAAAATETALDEEVKRLTHLSRLAEAEGVILSVETQKDTVTADPTTALQLCQRVPGLGLSLDPSQYIVGPNPHPDYDALYPHVRHVRLRDSAPDRPQVRIGQGQIEYGKIVTLLEREGYDRALSVDMHDLPAPEYPIEPEVRKLKFLLESMV